MHLQSYKVSVNMVWLNYLWMSQSQKQISVPEIELTSLFEINQTKILTNTKYLLKLIP